MGLLKQLGRATLRVVKRFLGNQPANAYESIVFNAIRLAATQFGGRTKPV